MEAEVYACGADAVLKLYKGTASLADLLTLQDFYNSLDRQAAPFSLPHIHTVAQEGEYLVTVEQRLAGTRLSAILPTAGDAQLDSIIWRYISASLAVSQIAVRPSWERCKLFDPHQLSLRADGDWHQFLDRYITHKLAQLHPYFNRDVPQFSEKLGRLRAILSQPYQNAYGLIHGDFFPGNLLVDEAHHITALLDFGLFTMLGDPLFDLATAWVFFDMYDELKKQLRQRILPIIVERLGENVRGKLYRYVLIYSILSANTYSPTCADGHYQWCVANLNQPAYWQM
jgi:streptomycin 6-kinase